MSLKRQNNKLYYGDQIYTVRDKKILNVHLIIEDTCTGVRVEYAGNYNDLVFILLNPMKKQHDIKLTGELVHHLFDINRYTV